MIAHMVQLDIAWEDKPENERRVDGLLASSSVAPGDLVVLPELFDTGFSFRLEKTADTDGRTLDYLRRTAAARRITIQGSRTVIGTDGRGRNRATIVGPGGEILAEYDKIHPFSFGKESEHFTGGKGVVVYKWRDATDELTVCPAICYDLRFPELFRQGVTLGAELIAIGANWPAPRALHRQVLLQARAIENQACVLGVNRAGRDPHHEYAGASMAFGPRGEPLAAGDERECVVPVVIDPGQIRRWRADFPALRDARLLDRL
ncbi:MAG: nitrilase-related carbon-nitrogen hydrolase [Planctomycetota bacterium]